MFWKRLFARGFLTASERAVHEHSQWLTAMLESGGAGVPRIPVRRVDQGGFDTLRKKPGGIDRASKWWQLALERVPD